MIRIKDMYNGKKTRKQLIEEIEALQKDIADLKRINKQLMHSQEALRESEELFRQVIQQLPYPLEIFSPDGTAVMVNQALLDQSGIPSAELVIGKYNIFNDPTIEELGLKDYVKQVFSGEIVNKPEIKVPLKYIEDAYGMENSGRSFVYQDVILFPVFNSLGEVSQVAALFRNYTRHSYDVRENINRAIEFLEELIIKKYNLEDVARAANLSPYHFIRVFKAQTGKTPYEYLLYFKIEKAKEKLKNKQHTITEISLACGFASPSHFTAVFKKALGVTPSEYRKILTNKQQ